MPHPLSLSSILPEVLKEFGLEKKAMNYSVLTSWEEIVGPKVAAVTKAERLERGVLTVKVANSVWRYELTLHSKSILQKIATQYGPGVVTEIHWKL
jgi:predicted nucleic acid-binding Zn ribbon protein